MGMFDELKCSFNIGELTNVLCQTKDIDPWEGGTMSFYWIDPAGQMWATDTSGCTAIEYKDANGPLWNRIKYVPTGLKGRIYPLDLTRELEIYRTVTHPDGYVETTYCQLLILKGTVEYFEYINNV